MIRESINILGGGCYDLSVIIASFLHLLGQRTYLASGFLLLRAWNGGHLYWVDG